jgi:thioredoxin 2
MAEPIHIVCPHCHATNRARPDKLSVAKCGQCGRQLFTGHPVELTSSAFVRHIDRSEIPVVVDFWASWCGPCLMMVPEFEKAAQQLEPTVRFAKVNTENEQGIAARYGIQSIPTIILFRGGREIARQSGALNASQLSAWIRAQG